MEGGGEEGGGRWGGGGEGRRRGGGGRGEGGGEGRRWGEDGKETYTEENYGGESWSVCMRRVSLCYSRVHGNRGRHLYEDAVLFE